MFETEYNEEMEKEVKRLEAKQRADKAGYPEWENACASCGTRLSGIDLEHCETCSQQIFVR